MIHFPKSAFRAAIRGYTRRDGRGLDEHLWRELLQNCRDAGATRVDATLVEGDSHVILTVRDNGRGMSWPVLEAGMLTYGGSIKPEGAAGGFGMAKLVICFSSDETIIRTLDSAVRIDGLHFERLPVEAPLSGTEITIRAPKSEPEDTRLQPTAEGLRFLLARTDLRGMRVYLDGQQVPDCRHALEEDAVVQSWDWGERVQARAYYWKRRRAFAGLEEGSKVAVVRHRGIWVYDIPLPDEVSGALIIEIDADPKLVLNDTRTTLASYWQRSEIDRWIGRLNQGARSVLSRRSVERFDGAMFSAREVVRRSESQARQHLQELALTPEQEVADAERLRAAIEALHAELAHTLEGDRLPGLHAEMASAPGLVLARVQGGDVNTSSPSAMARAVRTLLWQPALMVVNERDDRSAPSEYRPERMGARVRSVLRMWAELVRQFCLWQGEERPFGVGWVFSEDAAAQFRSESDGTIWFLLRPVDSEGRLDWKLTSSQDRTRMILAAAHEVAHAAVSDTIHGDRFVEAYERNLQRALDSQDVLHGIWRETR